MAENNDKKILNAPHLRFPEFGGEWEAFRNDILFDTISEKNKKKEFTDVLSASQTEGMVLRNSLGINIKFEEDSIKTYKIVRPGDYVIHLRSFQGGFAFSDVLGVCSPAYTILRPSEKKLSYGFLRPLFMSRKFIDSLRIVIYGIRDGKSISTEEWLKLYTFVPAKQEQDKITTFIKLIDQRIATQNKIIEDLKKLKSAIIEKLYSDINGREYSYRQIFEIVNDRNKQFEYSNILSASQEKGMVNREELNLDIQFERSNINTYKIVREGDYVIHLRSFQGGFAFSDKLGAYSAQRIPVVAE